MWVAVGGAQLAAALMGRFARYVLGEWELGRVCHTLVRVVCVFTVVWSWDVSVRRQCRKRSLCASCIWLSQANNTWELCLALNVDMSTTTTTTPYTQAYC